MTYRESARPQPLFICGACYRTISKERERPCSRCHIPRIPFDDASVKAKLYAMAEDRVANARDGLGYPIFSALHAQRAREFGDLRPRWERWLGPARRPAPYQIADPANMDVPALIEWLNVVEE